MSDAPAPEELEKWHKWFAVECNNRAWRLAEQASRTPAENEEMLHCAHAAALHWAKVGTEVHHARAAILLGQAHALIGDGKSALQYAREAFAYVSEHESPAWQVAFAHAVLANAAAANDERSLHSTHYARAKALGGALTDDEERTIFEATFRTVPAPG
ncbi:MAG: hypothetical protein E6H57_11405 [Betaproteobacteria bacterium]|nr:MAG: hypothetical protein E6H57_11405 [Betaproteobacteria bacterium]